MRRLDPIFKTIAPGRGRRRADARAHPQRRHGRRVPALRPNGAGHFVKMVHNGVEYGMMAAIAEGLSIIKHADAGAAPRRSTRRPRRCATRRPTSTTSTSRRWPSSGAAARWSARGWSTSPPTRSPARRSSKGFAGRGLGLGRGTLDGAGRRRRGGAGTGDHRVALPALRIAALRRVHRQGALGDALASSAATPRSPPRAGGPASCTTISRCWPTRSPWGPGPVLAFVATTARGGRAERGRCTVAVSGGHTPWAMFAELVAQDMPWEQIVVYQVDERVAPADDAERNLHHLTEALGGAPATVVPMPVEADDLGVRRGRLRSGPARRLRPGPPRARARRAHGVLVPHDPVLDVTDRLVALTGPYQGRVRMTLTYPSLAQACQLLWLVTGADKRDPLRRLLAGDRSIPAGAVEAAASLVLADAAAGRPGPRPDHADRRAPVTGDPEQESGAQYWNVLHFC